MNVAGFLFRLPVRVGLNAGGAQQDFGVDLYLPVIIVGYPGDGGAVNVNQPPPPPPHGLQEQPFAVNGDVGDAVPELVVPDMDEEEHVAPPVVEELVVPDMEEEEHVAPPVVEKLVVTNGQAIGELVAPTVAGDAEHVAPAKEEHPPAAAAADEDVTTARQGAEEVDAGAGNDQALLQRRRLA